MNRNKRELAIGVVSLVIITAVISFALSAFIFSGKALSMDLFSNVKVDTFNTDKIVQIKELLKQSYLKGTDDQKLLDGAIEGMTNSLGDPYTVYMNKKEFETLKLETSGSYAGIGIVVTAEPKTNTILVVSPIEDTPGQRAGILPGDTILKVDGKEVKGTELDQAVSMMKGKPDTIVKLTLKRKDVKDPIVKTITRANIIIKSVKDKVVNKNLGYIRIASFDEKTYLEFMKSYNKLMRAKVKGIIIDVRDNPGGLLSQTIKIADRLIPKGIVVYTEDRNKKRNTWNSDVKEAEVPLVVLVNGSSASASEILAGALKDTKKATLIGTKTFGKGVVQEVIELEDGTALKVTISQYFTPKGISIDGKGITPDIVVNLPEKVKTSLSLEEKDDTQLKKAIEVLNSKIKK